MAILSDLLTLAFLPAWAKGALVVLLAYNIHSFPFVWHYQVLKPVAKLLLIKKDPEALVKHTKGRDPTELKRVVTGYRAWPSHIDYLLHKNNATYASDMDVARSAVAVDWFAPFLAVGGLLPVAGTTHRFLNEIPPLAKYDVEISYGGFGDKWIFAVGQFVSHPARGSRGAKRTPAVPETPATASGTSSPSPFKKLAATRLDGGIVHCTSVSVFCFKIGRLTIPPAVVLSMCAYGDASNYARHLALHKAGPKATLKYLKGGWKDDADAVKAVEAFAAQGKIAGEKGEAMRAILEEYGVSAPI